MSKAFECHTPEDTNNLRVEMPRTIVHGHSYGKTSPYFRALAEGIIIGTRCVECNLTFLPPRPDCPDCWQETEWVRLPQRGNIATFAIVRYPGAGYEEALETVGAELPSIIVYVEIPGVDTKIMSRLEECEPDDVYIGMPVEARFVPKPNMNALDLYWVPRRFADPPPLSTDFSLGDPEGRAFKIDERLEGSIARVYSMFWHLSSKASRGKGMGRILPDTNKSILIQTAGGEIFLNISEGVIRGMAYAHSRASFPVVYRHAKPDMILAARDPEEFLRYFEEGVALTHLIAEGSLWASHPDAETIDGFDRLLETLKKKDLWPF